MFSALKFYRIFTTLESHNAKMCKRFSFNDAAFMTLVA